MYTKCIIRIYTMSYVHTNISFVLIHINIIMNMYVFLFISFIAIYLLFMFLLLYSTNSYAKR